MFKKPVVLVFVFFVFVFELFIYSTRTNKDHIEINNRCTTPSFELNENIDFCGEAVPLYSQDILERYEREILKNAHWHSEITILFKRTGKYFPLIERILKEEGVPDDFKYVCIIESGLSNVVSPVGASGFWQIMKETGKEYGLEINKHVDERYHLEKSTRVACAYFKRAYKRFNSWTLAAASYNMGMNGLARRLKKQNVSNYYDLLLNKETSRYVFRTLALKEILSSPARYSFDFEGVKKYKLPPLKELSVDTSISNLTEWAESQGVNYKILKLYNPWLRRLSFPNKSMKHYSFQIPVGWVFKFSKQDTLKVEKKDSLIAPYED